MTMIWTEVEEMSTESFIPEFWACGRKEGISLHQREFSEFGGHIIPTCLLRSSYR